MKADAIKLVLFSSILCSASGDPAEGIPNEQNQNEITAKLPNKLKTKAFKSGYAIYFFFAFLEIHLNAFVRKQKILMIFQS